MENIRYKSIKKTVIIFAITSLIYIIPLIIGMTVMYSADNSVVIMNKSSFYNLICNNLSLAALNMCGFFTFGISTIANLIMNGFIHGITIRNYYNANDALSTIMRILPHGLFEIPGIILSSIVGIMPLIYIFYYIVKKKKIMRLKQLLRYILIMIILSFLFIFIGGIIEVCILKIL